MRNHPYAASLILAAAVICAGWAYAGAPSGKSAARTTIAADVVEVSMKNLTFIPDPITIKVGQTVRWTNNDDRDYSIMAKDQSFKSGNLRPKEKFEHKFTEPGRIDYFDVMRPRVMGTVIIEAK